MGLSEGLAEVRYVTDVERRKTGVILPWEVWLLLLKLLLTLLEQVEQQEGVELIRQTLEDAENPQESVPEALQSQAVLSQSRGNPWVESAGIFKDDPMFDEFVEEMARHRREIDRLIAEQEAEVQERRSA